jgi:hypothetical protein
LKVRLEHETFWRLKYRAKVNNGWGGQRQRLYWRAIGQMAINPGLSLKKYGEPQ